MYYKNRGTTISFPCSDQNNNPCEIFATYNKNDSINGKYDVELKLIRNVHVSGQEFKFEHVISKELLSGNPTNIKTNIGLVVEYGLSHGKFQKHFSQFSKEIKSSLFI